MTGVPAKTFGSSVPRSVAVVRMLRGLGDMLCLVPALRALRAALPKAGITLIGLPWAKEFVARFGHYVDELVESPGYPGIPEAAARIDRLPRFFAAMQERRFDLALQMHGNGTVTNPFTVLLGARLNAGFFVPGQFCPDRDRFLPYEENEPEVIRHLRLLALLGISPVGENLEFPLYKEDRRALAVLPETRNLWPRTYVCVHPGSSGRGRRWPAERFALLADAISDLGMPVVLTGNTSEAGLTRQVARAMKARPIDCSGRTTLGAIGVLLSNAMLLVSNDTGISHLAAALQVPSVVIFTDSEADRWAPLDRDLHRVVAADPPAGEAALKSPARRPGSDVEKALAAAKELLRRQRHDTDREPLRSKVFLRHEGGSAGN
jgi:ADP-heptose:LPS heptosyltransferase